MAATTPAALIRGLTYYYLRRLRRMYPNAREHEAKLVEVTI
jgi:hypothetical protein